MSLPSVSVQPQPLPKAKPRFGEGPSAKSENPAKAEHAEAAIQTEPIVEDQFEFNDGAEKKGEAQKHNPFVAFGKRIEQFFKDLAKAIRKLFSPQKPKPEWEVQLKRLKHNLRKSLNEEKLAANLKRRTEELDAMTPEQRKPFDIEYKVLKSENAPRALVSQTLNGIVAGLAFQNEVIESIFANEEEKPANSK